ncbi:MAG: hypothetical protein LAN59_16225 [Acidobacteriia bacterium]|nr:hypothetical protein [Terriglobia bacterium]
MRCNPAMEISCGDSGSQEESGGASHDPRREYNRDYMRRRRADPAFQAAEHERRQRQYYARKARRAEFQAGQSTNLRGEEVCAYCGRRPPVEHVMRLQICEQAPDGYVEVRIPYCGLC